jgi:hypothetical protein
MTRQILSRLMSYDLRESDAKQNTVYLRLRDGRGHDIGITVYGTSPEELLPFLIQN